jgi:beta-lactamase regulating signal transducer with metallopeptidase domain
MTIETAGLIPVMWMHVWQIAVLVLVVGGVNLVIGPRWPHMAYALWLVVLAKCFVPPLAGGPLNIWRSWSPLVANVAWVESASLTNAEVGNTNRATSLPPTRPVSESEHNAAADQSTDRNVSVGLVPRPSVRLQLARSLQAAPFVWLFGSALLLGIAIGRGAEVGRRLRRTSIPISDALQSTVERLAKRIGLKRAPCVMQTSSDIGPLVAGIWRPRVYVPAFLVECAPPAQLEAMLLHELAHVRRRDTWVACLQLAAHVLWWFHPLVWWMNREISRQRERSCDEEVVANLGRGRSDYARLLVSILEARHRLEPLWGYPAVRPVELTRRRLEEIMKRKNMVHVRAPLWCWLIAAASAVLVVPGAGSPAAAEDHRDADASHVNATFTEDGQLMLTSPDARALDRMETLFVAQNVPRSGEPDRTRNRPPALLAYGDGKADGKKSFGGSGHMIRFELPEGITSVRGLRIHGSRYGLPQAPDEDFEITFLSDDREETLDTKAAPYRLFKRGKESWVRVLFDEEVELPQKFWVALNFNAHQTKGVYVSYDTSTKGEHSRVGLAGDEEKPKETDFGGDWMVQVMLPRPAATSQR